MHGKWPVIVSLDALTPAQQRAVDVTPAGEPYGETDVTLDALVNALDEHTRTAESAIARQLAAHLRQVLKARHVNTCTFNVQQFVDYYLPKVADHIIAGSIYDVDSV
jgi:hypothetical protein